MLTGQKIELAWSLGGVVSKREVGVGDWEL